MIDIKRFKLTDEIIEKEFDRIYDEINERSKKHMAEYYKRHMKEILEEFNELKKSDKQR